MCSFYAMFYQIRIWVDSCKIIYIFIKKTMRCLYIIAVCVLLGSSCSRPVKHYNTDESNQQNAYDLQRFETDKCNIDIPRNWTMITQGECDFFAWAAYDTLHPETRVFLLETLGPVYLGFDQKRYDLQYMHSLGFDIPWFDMPVVTPFEPSMFLTNITAMLQTPWALAYSQIFPNTGYFSIITSEKTETFILGGKSEVLRVVYYNGSEVIEMLCLINLAPYTGAMGEQKVGLGAGYAIFGLTAPASQFNSEFDKLLHIAASYRTNEFYVDECLTKANAFSAEIVNRTKTLKHLCAVLRNDFENRSESEDIKALQAGDMLQGMVRVYDAKNRQVFRLSSNGYSDLLENNSFSGNVRMLNDNDSNLWLLPITDTSLLYLSYNL